MTRSAWFAVLMLTLGGMGCSDVTHISLVSTKQKTHDGGSEMAGASGGAAGDDAQHDAGGGGDGDLDHDDLLPVDPDDHDSSIDDHRDAGISDDHSSGTAGDDGH
ncbi:MAG TPA: hypothetical protein VHM19_14705 [Polyangiales bacterium]|nr:hypothetical protein [Polyangiales bacterium]